MITTGSVASVGDLLQRAVSGDAGTGERRHPLRRQVADVEQVARMRNHQVIAVAAGAEHADAAGLEAELLVAAPAHPALAAAHPRIDQPPVADLDALRRRTDRHHLADVLVPERHRQLHAALDDAEPLAAAEIEVAVGKVQIAVADAGRQHLQQHLAAGRLGRRPLGKLQRLAALADLKASHGASWQATG
jgi:hypothetical protein